MRRTELIVLAAILIGFFLTLGVMHSVNAISGWNPQITIHVVHSGYIEER